MADDASTVLNPGSGGDTLDETLVTQADGTTQAKRARVDAGFGADDGRGRLVDLHTPLPVEERNNQLLRQMAADVREILNLIREIV